MLPNRNPEDPPIVYKSTKTYSHDRGLSCAFRQWKAQSHCKFIHGYALSVKAVFASEELDERNWVVDFGSLKSFKGWLEELLDHTVLVATDDPMYHEFKRLHGVGIIQMREVTTTGCEGAARLVFEYLELWLQDNGYHPRVWLESVEVAEHGGNSGIVARHPYKWPKFRTPQVSEP